MVLGPHKMKMSHYFSVSDTLWNLGGGLPVVKEMNIILASLLVNHKFL